MSEDPVGERARSFGAGVHADAAVGLALDGRQRCEQNTLLAAVLRALGCEVDTLEATLRRETIGQDVAEMEALAARAAAPPSSRARGAGPEPGPCGSRDSGRAS